MTGKLHQAARLHQVIDPAGGVATYEYDVSGDHLVRVTTTAGTTEYTYTADAGGACATPGVYRVRRWHASVLRLRQPRPLGASAGRRCAGILRYAYDSTSFSTTDVQNQVTTYFYDSLFRFRRIVDPLGRVSTIEYNTANQQQYETS